ncbi:hypothetical protein [Acinetobacter seifertii]|uniref:hypothetical protein n=1 Tax=Acinetobacter seifertii TaxID=1530123 RepID=UPI003EE1147D
MLAAHYFYYLLLICYFIFLLVQYGKILKKQNIAINKSEAYHASLKEQKRFIFWCSVFGVLLAAFLFVVIKSANLILMVALLILIFVSGKQAHERYERARQLSRKDHFDNQ